MLQIAAFVDAGYMYAQGAKLLGDRSRRRNSAILNVEKALKAIMHSAKCICPESEGRLLRVYWYDGLTRGRELSADQKAVANTDLAKLRLGTISMGRQKGVDSLIVTDLIELARNRAITDALVLSGDEDIRVGVQIAQTYGIQIHLLGIKPSRGSQSESLKQESDTCQEWDETDVGEFLSIRQEPPSKKIDEVIPFVQPDVAKPLEEIMDEQITRMLPVLVSRMQGKTALLMQDPHP